MKYEIQGETLAGSTQCSHYFDCLLEGRCAKCEIERLVAGIGAHIRTPDLEPCPYKLDTGTLLVCTCPTRIELYERYGT
jgi:hypothetical protein